MSNELMEDILHIESNQTLHQIGMLYQLFDVLSQEGDWPVYMSKRDKNVEVEIKDEWYGKIYIKKMTSNEDTYQFEYMSSYMEQEEHGCFSASKGINVVMAQISQVMKDYFRKILASKNQISIECKITDFPVSPNQIKMCQLTDGHIKYMLVKQSRGINPGIAAFCNSEIIGYDITDMIEE